MSSNKPLVSVCMITYNQAEYIGEALESVLNQTCNFDYEVILSNDSSNDNSDDLIRNLIQKHPNGFRVNYTNQPVNLGMNSNFRFVYENAKGKYIAMCEGDDYWTDPYKIQKQVDFLEANTEFVICYHPVEVLFPDGKMEVDYGIKEIFNKSESNIYDLAVFGNYIHTPSVVFKNVLNEFPDSLKKSPIGDFFLWMILAQRGNIKKLTEVMAVYRIGVGIHSTQGEESRQLAFLKTLSILSETIEEKTLVEILKNRIATIKLFLLPYPVRSLENFGDLKYAESLKDYVSFIQLIKALWLKIQKIF